uniref:Uncharacterized protein n=1 Tax=Anopheles farauti TaxID=69004 RepID=A0A182Q6H5_9DIPT
MVNTMESSYATMSNISQHTENFPLPELTPEQQKLLIELRRKKQEILLEIQLAKRKEGTRFLLSLHCIPSGQLPSASGQCRRLASRLPAARAALSSTFSQPKVDHTRAISCRSGPTPRYARTFGMFGMVSGVGKASAQLQRKTREPLPRVVAALIRSVKQEASVNGGRCSCEDGVKCGGHLPWVRRLLVKFYFPSPRQEENTWHQQL